LTPTSVVFQKFGIIYHHSKVIYYWTGNFSFNLLFSALVASHIKRCISGTWTIIDDEQKGTLFGFHINASLWVISSGLIWASLVFFISLAKNEVKME